MFFLVRLQILKTFSISKYQRNIGFAVWFFWNLTISGQASSGYISAQSRLCYLWFWSRSSLGKHCLWELVPIKRFGPPAPDWYAALSWAPAPLRPEVAELLWWVRHFLGSFSSGKGREELCYHRCLSSRSCDVSSSSERCRGQKHRPWGQGPGFAL